MIRSTAKRAGNKRGFGGDLRHEIVAAAERLLARSGSREAVTLRAIAREAGIAAPSIYAHFADRDAILDVVVARAFEQLETECRVAAESAEPGIDEVMAISSAYISFARSHPGQYRTLFERAPSNLRSPALAYPAGLQAFDLLLRALGGVETSAPSTDRSVAAQGLFVALHGIATLTPALPGFPWHDEETLVRSAVENACR